MPQYRIGENPLTSADPITAHMFMGIALYAVVVGVGFVIAGRHGRQRWMVFWGAGLSLTSVAYLMSRLF